jgi:hypothetical protein
MWRTPIVTQAGQSLPGGDEGLLRNVGRLVDADDRRREPICRGRMPFHEHLQLLPIAGPGAADEVLVQRWSLPSLHGQDTSRRQGVRVERTSGLR